MGYNWWLTHLFDQFTAANNMEKDIPLYFLNNQHMMCKRTTPQEMLKYDPKRVNKAKITNLNDIDRVYYAGYNKGLTLLQMRVTKLSNIKTQNSFYVCAYFDVNNTRGIIYFTEDVNVFHCIYLGEYSEDFYYSFLFEKIIICNTVTETTRKALRDYESFVRLVIIDYQRPVIPITLPTIFEEEEEEEEEYEEDKEEYEEEEDKEDDKKEYVVEQKLNIDTKKLIKEAFGNQRHMLKFTSPNEELPPFDNIDINNIQRVYFLENKSHEQSLHILYRQTITLEVLIKIGNNNNNNNHHQNVKHQRYFMIMSFSRLKSLQATGYIFLTRDANIFFWNMKGDVNNVLNLFAMDNIEIDMPVSNETIQSVGIIDANRYNKPIWDRRNKNDHNNNNDNNKKKKKKKIKMS